MGKGKWRKKESFSANSLISITQALKQECEGHIAGNIATDQGS